MTRRGQPEAVSYLRRRTVGRAADSYRRWIGRAVGWWSILYMLFWLVVFVIAGVETLAPLPQFLPSPALFLALAGGFAVVVTLLGGRTPPVILDRRDLYRLALGPQRPWSVLRWRYRVKQASGVAVALLLGAVWSLVAPSLFGFSVPYAAPALALAALTLLDLKWLRYVGHDQHGDHAARGPATAAAWLVGGAALLLLVGGALSHYLRGAVAPGAGAPAGAWSALTLLDPLAALSSGSPLTLLVPLLLALVSHRAVRRSLLVAWPPRFAPQSLVLTQMQAIRTFQMMAVLAGMGARVADDGERRRLLDALHDRPGATRPRRSLPLPGVEAPQWLALAWRTASALYRRPLPRLAFSLVIAFLAALTALLASGGGAAVVLAGTAGPEGGPAGAGGGLLTGALAVLLAAVFVARSASGLLGPQFDIGVRPVDPLTRAFGRTLPALALLVLLLVPALVLLVGAGGALGGMVPGAGGAAAPGFAGAADLLPALLPALIGAVTLVAIVVLALEKYSSWSGAAASRLEPQIVAAMLAALPALVLGALGVGEWTLISQFLLLGLVAIIPV